MDSISYTAAPPLPHLVILILESIVTDDGLGLDWMCIYPGVVLISCLVTSSSICMYYI